METDKDDMSPLSPASLLSFDAVAAKQQYAALHEAEEREELRELTAQKRMLDKHPSLTKEILDRQVTM